MAVPPAIFRPPVLAVHRFPSHADFLQYPNGCAVVDIDGGYHPFGAQLGKRCIDQGQRDFRRVTVAPLLRTEHVAQVHDLGLDQGQVAGTDQPSGRDFLHGEFEARARQFDLRSQQLLQVFGRALFVARSEKKIAGDPRIR